MSARRLLVVLLLVLVLPVPASSWTTLAPLPGADTTGFYAHVYNNALYVVNMLHTHKLDLSAGVPSAAVWATLASQPNSAMHRSNTLTPAGVVVLAGPSDVDLFDLPTETWTVGTSVPTWRWAAASALIGNLMWNMGGAPVTSVNEEYNVAQDTWTTRAAVPTARAGASAACDGDDACFLFVGATTAPFTTFTDVVERYTPSADVWTTRQRAPIATAPINNIVTEQPTNFYTLLTVTLFNAYLAPTDEWTTLSAGLPVAQFRSGAVRLSSGVFCVGNNVDSTAAHYYAGTFASLLGDPVVTTFDGKTLHLDLYAGVFNLFTTPTTLVSAMVEVVPSLPPDENHVMTVVAVAGEVDGTVFWLDCSIQASEHTAFSCTKGSSAPLDVFSFEDNLMAISLPAFTIEISLSRCAVALPTTTIGDRLVYPAWLDVRVHSRCLLPPPCLGLLCYNASRPVQDYEVGSGSLFETNPHQMAVASAGLFAVSLP